MRHPLLSSSSNTIRTTTAAMLCAGLAFGLGACTSSTTQDREMYAMVGGKKVDVPNIDMGTLTEVDAIVHEGKHNSKVMEILRVYVEEHGPRLTGSTRLLAAQTWARDSLEAWGLSNSELSNYSTLATRFDRGDCTGTVFFTDSNNKRKKLRSMEFTTLSWTRGTDGPTSGHVVTLPTTMSEYHANQGNYSGAWVLIAPDFEGKSGIRSTGYLMRDRNDERHELRQGIKNNDKPSDQPLVPGIVWEGSFDYNGSKVPAKLIVDESGSNINGQMIIEGFAEGPITGASRDGDTLNFGWKHSMGTSKISVTFDGKSASGVSKSSSGKEYPVEFTMSDEASVTAEELAELDRKDALAAVLAENPNGFVSSSKDERVWTTSANDWKTRELKDYPLDIEVNVRQSDYDFISTRIKEGLDIEVEFDLEHTLTPGPIKMFNVIAEIPGTTKPDEVVIISAHIDSWDGPGSKGAIDNGTGSAVVTEAARILMQSGVKPERTIRIALWGGEEQGLLGSKAYVESLSKEELAKISAMFVDDGGTNYQGGIPAADFMVDYLAAASAPTNGMFFSSTDYDLAINDDNPDNDEFAGYMNVNIRPTGAKINTHSGSDHAVFNRKGVPGFFWDETGRANYRHAWHTQNDTYDQAIEEYLIQSATNMAVVAFNLANAPELLPRDGEIFTDEASLMHDIEPVGSAHNHD